VDGEEGECETEGVAGAWESERAGRRGEVHTRLAIMHEAERRLHFRILGSYDTLFSLHVLSASSGHTHERTNTHASGREKVKSIFPFIQEGEREGGLACLRQAGREGSSGGSNLWLQDEELFPSLRWLSVMFPI